MLLQNTLLLALIYRYTNTSWLRAAGVLGGSVAAIASVLTGDLTVTLISALPIVAGTCVRQLLVSMRSVTTRVSACRPDQH
jgi:hypothetical protein